nr:sulfatase-like hydrolase/transferase [Chitinispirillaceae bacterium]
VRMAGAPTAWFGKYEADGTTKHLSLGLAAEFQRWLDFYKIPKPSPIQGQQTNSYTKRSYATDPLDSRYGMAPGTAAGVEPDHHGKDLCPDGFSPTACEGSESLEALDRLSKTGKPFSLTVSFHYPHAPMVPTAKYYAMYKPDSLITPKSIADALTNSAYANANNRKTIGAGYQDPIKVRRWMADYYGLVTEIDEWVGKLLTKLDSLNLSSRTLVVFMSDHGEMLGSHGLREKNIFYEESARVPFIFRMPGKIPAGIVVNQPVTNIDLHATILDYLGNKGSYPSDGRSLRRFIEDTSASEEYIVTEWNYTDSRAPRAAGSELNFMIRFGSWKLMVPNTAASTVKDMLFNISSDPYEVSNLVGLNGLTASNAVIGKAEHLKALLAEYLTKMNHPAMTEIKNRRKWKTVDLWVSDTLIDFGTITRGKTKAESLYLGRTITGSVAISGMTLSGPGAANYKLSWTSGSIANGGQQIVTITYTDPGTGSAAGNAKITISHNAAGAARTVTLVSPKVTATALFQNKSNARNPVGASMKISYDKNRLRVTSHDNSFWKLTLCSLNGQAVREFSGQGSAQIACRTAPGIYLFRTEKPGTVRSGLLMIR